MSKKIKSKTENYKKVDDIIVNAISKKTIKKKRKEPVLTTYTISHMKQISQKYNTPAAIAFEICADTILSYDNRGPLDEFQKKPLEFYVVQYPEAMKELLEFCEGSKEKEKYVQFPDGTKIKKVKERPETIKNIEGTLEGQIETIKNLECTLEEKCETIKNLEATVDGLKENNSKNKKSIEKEAAEEIAIAAEKYEKKEKELEILTAEKYEKRKKELETEYKLKKKEIEIKYETMFDEDTKLHKSQIKELHLELNTSRQQEVMINQKYEVIQEELDKTKKDAAEYKRKLDTLMDQTMKQGKKGKKKAVSFGSGEIEKTPTLTGEAEKEAFCELPKRKIPIPKNLAEKVAGATKNGNGDQASAKN